MEAYSDRWCDPKLRVPDAIKDRYEGIDWHLAFVARLTGDEVAQIGGDFTRELARLERDIPETLTIVAYYAFDEGRVVVEAVTNDANYDLSFPVLNDVKTFFKTLDEGPGSAEVIVSVFLHDCLWEEVSR